MKLLRSHLFGFKAHKPDIHLNLRAGNLQIGLVMEVLQKLYFISFVLSCWSPIASVSLFGYPGRDGICYTIIYPRLE